MMKTKTEIDINSGTCLRGIFCIFVLAHHLFLYCNFQAPLIVSGIFQDLGFLSVSIFFFLSGYGLLSKMLIKDDYLQKFPRNRILVFYINTLIFLLIYLVFWIFRDSKRITIESICLSLSFGKTLIVNGWYLQVALLMYILFFFSFKIGKTFKLSFFLLSLSLLLLIFLLIVFNFPYYTYVCIPSFFVGVLFKNIEKKSKINSKTFLIFWISFVITLSSLAAIHFVDSDLNIIFYIICASFFPIFISEIIKKINIVCKPLFFIGKLSLEIYVLQGLFLWILQTEIIIDQSTIIKLLASMLITLVIFLVSVPTHFLIQKFNYMIKKD